MIIFSLSIFNVVSKPFLMLEISKIKIFIKVLKISGSLLTLALKLK